MVVEVVTGVRRDVAEFVEEAGLAGVGLMGVALGFGPFAFRSIRRGEGGNPGGEFEHAAGRIEEGGEEVCSGLESKVLEFGEVDALTAVVRTGVESGSVRETGVQALEEVLEDHRRRAATMGGSCRTRE